MRILFHRSAARRCAVLSHHLTRGRTMSSNSTEVSLPTGSGTRTAGVRSILYGCPDQTVWVVWLASHFTREDRPGVMPLRELYCCSQECSPIRSLHVTSNNSDSGICKNYGKIFIHKFAEEKVVRQNDVLKWYLAGTYSNQILHLNGYFRIRKDWRLKKSWFPKE